MHLRRGWNRCAGGDGAYERLGDVLGQHGFSVRFVLGLCQRVRFDDDGLAAFIFYAVDKFLPERRLPGTRFPYHGEDPAVRRGVVHHFPDIPDFRRQVDVGGLIGSGEGFFHDAEGLPRLHGEGLLS